jgi:hypothetical protein
MSVTRTIVCKYFIDHLVRFQNLEQRMHKSKLAGFIIDCQTTDLAKAAQFWGDALGMPVRDLPPRCGGWRNWAPGAFSRYAPGG